MVRTWCVLYILTSKCASRHNGVHFFNISIAKSGPELVCFVHFDLEMCFAPQRRALFRHLNFQKWSENGVLCTFSLGNVLRATTACTFSTSQLPKVVRRWCVLYILTSKCASRHNGVQFFISHLASWLRTRRFSEPTFRPSGAPNHWKNTGSRLSYLFTHLHLLSSDTFSSDLLSSNLSLLSASALLCFSSVHIVGSLTSKLPSVNRFVEVMRRGTLKPVVATRFDLPRRAGFVTLAMLSLLCVVHRGGMMRRRGAATFVIHRWKLPRCSTFKKNLHVLFLTVLK